MASTSPAVYIVLYQAPSTDALILGVYNSVADANRRARDHWSEDDSLKPDPSNADDTLGFRTASGEHTWVERHVVVSGSGAGVVGVPWDAKKRGKLYNNEEPDEEIRNVDGDAQYD